MKFFGGVTEGGQKVGRGGGQVCLEEQSVDAPAELRPAFPLSKVALSCQAIKLIVSTGAIRQRDETYTSRGGGGAVGSE